MPILLKFKIPLIYMAEGSSIHVHVIRDICIEGAQLWRFNMGTHLANWPCLQVQGVISFCGHSKCSSLHNGGVILLHDDAWPHMARQTWKLLQKFNWEMDHPPHVQDLVPTDFHLFPALKENLSGLFHLHLRHQMCYHYMADATWTHSMHLRWTDLSYAMTDAQT